MENKFKELHQKLNSIGHPLDDHEPHQKTKIKTFQAVIVRLQAKLDNENINQ